MSLKVISTQSDWERIRDEFERSSDYREFSKRYSFNPSSRVKLTGMTIRDALPRAEVGKPRWQIFEKAIRDGVSVEQVNQQARAVCQRTGGKAEVDGDLFIALFRGYAELR